MAEFVCEIEVCLLCCAGDSDSDRECEIFIERDNNRCERFNNQTNKQGGGENFSLFSFFVSLYFLGFSFNPLLHGAA